MNDGVSSRARNTVLLIITIIVQLACIVSAALIWHGLLPFEQAYFVIPLGIGGVFLAVDTVLITVIMNTPKRPKTIRTKAEPEPAQSNPAPSPAQAPIPEGGHTEYLHAWDKVASSNETMLLTTEKKLSITYYSDGKLRSAAIDRYPAVIGRSTSRATVIIDESSVSREHVKIEREDDGFYALNLSTSNGTLLGNALLEGRTLLRHGDTLKLGRVEVLVNIEG